VLMEGVRRGYSAVRVTAWIQARPEALRNGGSPTLQFEEIAAPAKPLPVVVRHAVQASTVAGTPGWSQELCNQVRSQMLADTGIDPGEVQWEPDPKMEPSRFRITINDLPLPDYGSGGVTDGAWGCSTEVAPDTLAGRVLAVLSEYAGSLLTTGCRGALGNSSPAISGTGGSGFLALSTADA
jgi:hypothetical protein